MLSENNNIKQDFIYYEDEEGETRHSSYKYSSVDSFVEFMEKYGVNMSKVNNPRMSE